MPGLIGGGADLTGNTGTELEGASPFSVTDRRARQIHFGVREHAMGSVMNGMAAHGGVLPVGGTFFVFTDYMRPAVRLAALSGLQVIYSWTHDSVGVGEDGPTHQPIEQLASLRAMPGPAGDPPGRRQRDRHRLAHRHRARRPHRPDPQPPEPPGARGHRRQRRVSPGAPTSLRGRPTTTPTSSSSAPAPRSSSASPRPRPLAAEGIAARVVSMPCWDLFDAQDDDYQASVLRVDVPTLSVEAGVTFGWSRWADASIGIDRFGASAPGGAC